MQRRGKTRQEKASESPLRPRSSTKLQYVYNTHFHPLILSLFLSLSSSVSFPISLHPRQRSPPPLATRPQHRVSPAVEPLHFCELINDPAVIDYSARFDGRSQTYIGFIVVINLASAYRLNGILRSCIQENNEWR